MEIINNIEYFTLKEWENKSGIKIKTIRDWCYKNKVKYIRIGKYNLINEKEFYKFYNNRHKNRKNSSRKKLTSEEIIKRIKEKLPINEYEIIKVEDGLQGIATIRHLKCNKIYETKSDNIIYQNNKCPYCYKKKAYTIDEVKSLTEKLDNDYKVLSNEYKSNKIPILFYHKKCKREFYMRFCDFKNLGRRCPHCKKSKAETKIEKYLNKLNIDFINNYKIQTNGHYYFVDFKINYKNRDIYIEFDGKQHFETNYMYKNYKNYGEKDLQITKERDFNKNKYFQDKKIFLYRISYNHFDDLENIINIILEDEKHETFNDYPLGEYSQVAGNGELPYIKFIW